MRPQVCPWECLNTYPFVCPCEYLIMCSYTCPVNVWLCVPVCPYECLSTCPYVCTFECLSICPYVCPYNCRRASVSLEFCFLSGRDDVLLIFKTIFLYSSFSVCFFCLCLNQLKVSPEGASCLRTPVTWRCILPTPTCHLKLHPTYIYLSPEVIWSDVSVSIHAI